MTTDERMPKWRNALSWAIAGFLVYVAFVLLIGVVIEGSLASARPESGGVIASMAAALVAASALVAFSKRNEPFNLRGFRNFLILSTLAIAAFLLARAWLVDTVSLAAIGPSAAVALILGLALLAFGILGLGLAAAAHARLGLQPPEQVETIVEQGRVLPYSCVVIAAMGLMLVLLGLAGPGGLLSTGVALAGVLVLLAIQTGLSFAIWPRLDELSQALSRETGNAAYYLIVVLGGGWAILAHLGFVSAPAPLDWLTMLTVIMFAASVIAAGRRGMLRHPAAE
jgi:hypothetical protein